MADDRPEERPQEPAQEPVQERPEEKLEDTTPLADSGRARRAPPTIDLAASEVSSETRPAGGDAATESASQTPRSEEAGSEKTRSEEFVAAESAATEPPAAVSAPISPWVIAPASGAVAAALVIGVGWMLGWPAVQPAAPAAPQVSAAAVDGLTARVAGLESKTSKPAAPATDPAAIARIAALEKSQGSLRDELAAMRAQSEKLAANVNGIKSAPGDAAAAAVDLSALNARLDRIESAARTDTTQEKSQASLRDELAAMRAQSEKLAANVNGIKSAPGDAAVAAVDLSALNARLDKIESAGRTDTARENAKPADDAALRRVVVASLLDLSVRQGDPFPATLNAAKSLAPEAASLKSLEGFASTGVPTAAILSRELLTLVPKLSPPVLGNDNVGSGLVDRLQAGALKLVRIERTDAVGNDRGAIVARVTAAALRNDSNEARRELKTLGPADRAAAQSWIDKADARDAALAASRQFAADAMAALAKPTQ